MLFNIFKNYLNSYYFYLNNIKNKNCKKLKIQLNINNFYNIFNNINSSWIMNKMFQV